MPSPESERYRQQVQHRIKSLLSGQRPRNPELSNFSIRRLILEGIIEEVKLYRLHKEEQVRRSKQSRTDQDHMASAAFKGLYKSGQSKDHRRRRSRSHDEHRGRPRERNHEHHQNRHDSDQGSRATDGLVTGATNRDNQDPNFMMAGGLPAGEVPACSHRSSPHSPGRNSPRPHSEPPKKVESHHRQRYDRNGKPLVRGGRGWKDASPGSPPRYKFKMGPTFGFATHVKSCMKWAKEEQELKERKAERRARGTLEERKEARRKMKAEEKGKGKEFEGGEHRRGREWSREHHGLDRQENSGRSCTPARNPNPELEDRHYAAPNRPNGAPDTPARAQAEIDARSRGERLAKAEARTGISPEAPPYPTYEETPHSQRIEERESAQNRHQGDQHRSASRIATERDLSPQKNRDHHSMHMSVDQRGSKFTASPSPQTQFSIRTTPDAHHNMANEHENVSTRTNADGDDQQQPSTRTMVTDWWSIASASSSDRSKDTDDEDDTGYFSDEFIEELRSRVGSGSSGTPQRHVGAVADVTRSNNYAKMATSRAPSPTTSDGGSIFSKFAAHVGKYEQNRPGENDPEGRVSHK